MNYEVTLSPSLPDTDVKVLEPTTDITNVCNGVNRAGYMVPVVGSVE